MPVDLDAVATAFVEALVSQPEARNAFYAAMHPRDDASGAAVVNEYAAGATPIAATDITALLVLIAEKLGATSGGGGAAISSSNIIGEHDGASGNIMPGDEGGGGSSIGDTGGRSSNIIGDRPDDEGGTAANIIGDGDGPKPE
jgi:hypothetical protein